jgi:5-methyltetrahydropteroyltriglutamate--homocysteine methyltransferase
MVHFRGGRKAIDIHAYPEMDNFFDDLAQCYRDEINALYQSGVGTFNLTIPTSHTSAT